jgi:hypothetical protein
MDTVLLFFGQRMRQNSPSQREMGIVFLKFTLYRIRDHSEYILHINTFNTTEDYKLYMGKNGLYGGNLELIAISKKFCVSVFIFYPGATSLNW